MVHISLSYHEDKFCYTLDVVNEILNMHFHRVKALQLFARACTEAIEKKL